MAELLNHRHCKNCGRALSASQELCPGDCETAWAGYQKKRSRTALFFYVLSAFLVLLLVWQLLPL